MGESSDGDLSPADVYDEMEVFEPYTTGEVASRFDAPRKRIRSLLERLSSKGKIRQKKFEPDRVLWIREPPVHKCPNCGYEYEVKFLHPVLSAVQFCPQCGSQV